MKGYSLVLALSAMILLAASQISASAEQLRMSPQPSPARLPASTANTASRPRTVVIRPTGAMSTAREYHTATLLKDGRVLVVGGLGQYVRGRQQLLNSAELYDVASGTWSVTTSMRIARTRHTATLLLDGRVLVAGGSSPGGIVASAELYDPHTGTWSDAPSMGSVRVGHAAVRLSNGKVLVAGGAWGVDVFSQLDSAELYDPEMNTWSSTGSFVGRRDGPSATALLNGKVLLVGGTNDDVFVVPAPVLYDPDSGTWGSGGTTTVKRRYLHAETLLVDGRVLVTGGEVEWAEGGSELYDPTSNTWSTTASTTAARNEHTATLLPDGQVLVAGGRDAYTSAPIFTEVYDPAAGTWKNAGNMSSVRYHHTATRLQNGAVLLAGGWDPRTWVLATADLAVQAESVWLPALYK